MDRVRARPEDANGHVQEFEEFFPLGGDFKYEFLRSAGLPGFVLHVTILKTAPIKVSSEGTPYVRRGAQNLPVTSPEQLRQLERAKGIISFENETVVRADIPEVTNSTAIIAFMLEVIPEREPDHWLRQRRLIGDDKVTVAGLLLFADGPQVDLPKASVKIYRYATTDPEGSRDTLVGQPIAVDGCLYDQIKHAVSTTTEMIEGIEILGPNGLQTVSSPPETLHEIITNAVLHRDYAPGDDVHVRVFDNRVEVESPGRLPAHITPANILDERFARNASLVRLISKFPDPPNKDVGEGLNTAFAAMKKLQLKEPEITQGEHSVRVTIRHERLASPEKLIVDYLKSNPTINNPRRAS
jgi:ATP-dependent DNA helicase RecG